MRFVLWLVSFLIIHVAHSDGRLQLLFQSSSFVTELQPQELNDVLEDENTHQVVTVVLFYGECCGYCHLFAPDYEALAKRYSCPDGTKRNVKFFAMESTSSKQRRQVVPKNPEYIKIVNLPTLIVFQKTVDGGKLVKVFEDVRLFDKWLQNNVNVTDSCSHNETLNDVPLTVDADVNATPFAKGAVPRDYLHDALIGLLAILSDWADLSGNQISTVESEAKLALVSLAKYVLPGQTLKSNLAELSTTITSPDLSKCDYENHIENFVLAGVTKNSSPRLCHSLTCTNWLLFHTLSLGLANRVESPEEAKQLRHVRFRGSLTADTSQQNEFSPQKVMIIIRDVIEVSMSCKHCRMHFIKSYDACSFGRCDWVLPTNVKTVINDAEDSLANAISDPYVGLAMWLWRLHNGVTLRVASYNTLHKVEDGSVTGPPYSDDLGFPPPSSPGCPKCRKTDAHPVVVDKMLLDAAKDHTVSDADVDKAAEFDLRNTYDFLQLIYWDK